MYCAMLCQDFSFLAFILDRPHPHLDLVSSTLCLNCFCELVLCFISFYFVIKGPPHFWVPVEPTGSRVRNSAQAGLRDLLNLSILCNSFNAITVAFKQHSVQSYSLGSVPNHQKRGLLTHRQEVAMVLCCSANILTHPSAVCQSSWRFLWPV